MTGNIFESAIVIVLLGGTTFFFGKKFLGILNGMFSKNQGNAKPGCGGCSGCGPAQAIASQKLKSQCH